MDVHGLGKARRAAGTGANSRTAVASHCDEISAACRACREHRPDRRFSPGRSELGSIQYAVEHLHTPLIATVGHAACGAVGAAVDVADGGSRPGGAVDDIVDHILPAVQKAKTEPGDDLMTKAIQVNARQSRDQLLADPLIAGKVKEGKLEVIAAYYALDDGRFVVLD